MHRRTLVPLALLLLPLTISACKPKQDPPSPVLLRVDVLCVTLADFRRDFEKTLPPGAVLTPAVRRDLEHSFLEQLIDRQLILCEAGRKGIGLTPGELAETLAAHRGGYPGEAFEETLQKRGITPEEWRSDLERRALVEKTLRQEAHAGIVVEDEEIADYYNEHRSAYQHPSQVRARQIVVAGEAEGKEALARLKGGEPFDAVARRLSLSPDGREGGDLGFFARGEMPPVFDAVFDLPVGRFSDLLRSEYGYHIVRVEERREGMTLPLERVREKIRAELRARKEEEACRKWLQNLRSRTSVEVNWSLLQGETPSEKKE